MASGYNVVWTAEAQFNLQNIIKYLEERWTEKELKRFSRKLEKRVMLISKRPRIFPCADNDQNIHRSVLSKQTTIYYQVFEEEKRVELITLFDTRQDPTKLRT